MTTEPSIQIAWCADPAAAEQLARFFADNVTPEYISHSELQGPRALDVGRWRPGLVDIFRDEIAGRVGQEKGRIDKAAASYPVLAARDGDRLAGLALVSLFPNAPVPYGIVEDIVIDKERRAGGIGKTILDWITREAEEAGCRRLFLESGLDNHRAHEFFHREGFSECSVVMMKTIRPPA